MQVKNNGIHLKYISLPYIGPNYTKKLVLSAGGGGGGRERVRPNASVSTTQSDQIVNKSYRETGSYTNSSRL